MSLTGAFGRRWHVPSIADVQERKDDTLSIRYAQYMLVFFEGNKIKAISVRHVLSKTAISHLRLILMQ